MLFKDNVLYFEQRGSLETFWTLVNPPTCILHAVFLMG